MKTLLSLLFAGLLAALPAYAFKPVGGSGANPPAYQGPCDLGATCAEAWSMDYATSHNYSGNLFQLALFSSPTTTMNVGQTASHKVNMSGVLSFCGGTYSNCAVSRIYAQVQGSSNDFVPNVFNGPAGPNCTAGGLTCACALTIDPATNLPIVPLNNGTFCEYSLTNDNAATGVTGGSASSTSLILVGQTVAVATECCGTFNISHRYDAGDVIGTDLGIQLNYSNSGGFVNCATANVFCLGADLESNKFYPSGVTLGTSPSYVEAYVSWDHVANLVYGAVNNRQAWTPQTPFTSMNPGTRVHIGGGGDLSQPAQSNAFEWMIFNSTLTAAQQTAIFNNVTPRYAGAVFP